MADALDQSRGASDEKHAIQHHENSDSEHHSHQEKVGFGSGSEEGMHESEMDIPVGFRSEIY
jgi:hypothetical protein